MREIFTNIYSYKKFIIHIYRLKKEKIHISNSTYSQISNINAHIKTTFTFQILNKQRTHQIILKNTNKLLQHLYNKTFNTIKHLQTITTNND